jgi:hypothetical protein
MQPVAQRRAQNFGSDNKHSRNQFGLLQDIGLVRISQWVRGERMQFDRIGISAGAGANQLTSGRSFGGSDLIISPGRGRFQMDNDGNTGTRH